jgi:hypothetical protein
MNSGQSAEAAENATPELLDAIAAREQHENARVPDTYL